MNTVKRALISIVILSFLPALASLADGQENAAASGQDRQILSGQTTTLLPDGSVAFIGGQDAAGHATNDILLRTDGYQRKPPLKLQFPRMWHTATVLPDGTVLILGGIGSDGQLVQPTEILDLQSGTTQVLGSGLPTPRAFHSATLLTDGRVLIAGGVSAGGQQLDNAELWDSRTRTTTLANGRLSSARREHSGALLADGRVLLNGGKDVDGHPFLNGDVFDPQLQIFSLIIDPKSLLSVPAAPPKLQVSIPQDGASDVAIDAVIALRFSRPLKASTVNATNFVLTQSDEVITARVVAAEGGMLAFVTPDVPLQPATVYSLKLNAATDNVGQLLPDNTINFTTGSNPSAGNDDGSDVGLNSPWRKLPPLQAGPNVTALAGQVLRLNGEPLAHVLLEIDKKTTFTDKTGRFLLRELTAGHHVMYIDGAPADADSTVYGLYRVGVDITAGQTNVLNYTIWMTQLDMDHVVRFPSPTTSEVVVTTPNIPGLELHIPPDIVIRDARGRVVTELGITPIPMRQPPFPLKRGVIFPVYFTIQPGGASFSNAGSSWSAGKSPRGAQIYYQNYLGAKPGTAYDFWNYDPTQKGWYVYGTGRVSGNQRMIIPDNSTQIWSFDGAMIADPSKAPKDGPKPANPRDGEPVDLQTGLFVHEKTDLILPDVVPIVLTRIYRQNDSISRTFGIGTSLTYDMFNVGDGLGSSEGYTYQDLILADGGRIHFTRTSPCNQPCGYTDAFYTATSSPGEWYGATVKWSSDSPVPGTAWVLTKRDGTRYFFRDSSGGNARHAAVLGIQDRHGNLLRLDRDGNDNLIRITSPNGRWIQLTYDASNRVTQAQDNSGRSVIYTYDGGGRLWKVTDANGGITTYAYDAEANMTTITDPRQILYITNEYDVNNRVKKQTTIDGAVYLFTYDLNQDGSVSQTTVTDPRTFMRKVTFNSDGYMTQDTRAFGQPEQQTITYERQAASGLIVSVTDALNRKTAFTYDSQGNATSITRLAGTSDAVVTSFGYEQAYSQLTSVTDPLNHTTTIARDSVANPVAITDVLGHQITMSFNSQGLPLTIADPLGNSTQFTYDGGDLVAITDPMGNTRTGFSDAIGRVSGITDAVGNTTVYGYNPLNEITRITDPLNGSTLFDYDENGNLKTLTDALNHSTTWSYDNMDRVQTRTDPLLRQEIYGYDLSGNLASFTDRKSQVTTVQYDGINRPFFVGFGTHGTGQNATYESTISSQFDAGNRLTQTVDSSSGTILFGYDGLDRETSETTPQGVVSYSYDGANRRTSLTVPCSSGLPACSTLSYIWDTANRLTNISQGTSNIVISYDDANRRTSLLMPNGVTVGYAYDNNSQVTGITYDSATSRLGNFAYSYDVLGRRTQTAGSFARTSLPPPINSAVYDAGNELTNWNGAAVSYDLNGNMLSDGSNTFAWDARDQLSALNGNSLQYDAFGRRTKNFMGTYFLYDGFNAVQEISNGVVTANIMSGNLDEVFVRTDASGESFLLKDILASTVALMDANGNISTSYTYDPFGGTTLLGQNNGNTYQFAGRENEGGGLYYYRARYYNSMTGRFAAEDPIGYAGGANLYIYVDDDPTGYVDPFGLEKKKRPSCKDLPKKVEAAQRSVLNYAFNQVGQTGVQPGLDGISSGPFRWSDKGGVGLRWPVTYKGNPPGTPNMTTPASAAVASAGLLKRVYDTYKYSKDMGQSLSDALDNAINCEP